MEYQYNYEKKEIITPFVIDNLKREVSKNKDNNNLIIEGRYIEKILIVGKIIKFEKLYNKITIEVDDSTDIIKLAIYKNINEAKPNILNNINLKKFDYYKFFCQVSNLKNELNLYIISIDKVTTLNEFTFHFVNSIKSHYIRKYGYLNDDDKVEFVANKEFKKDTKNFEMKEEKINNDDEKKIDISQEKNMKNEEIKEKIPPINENRNNKTNNNNNIEYLSNLVFNKIQEYNKNNKAKQFTPSLILNHLNQYIELPKLIKILNDWVDDGKLVKSYNIYSLKL